MPICRDCKEEKDQGDFVQNRAMKRGYDTICHICNRRRTKEYRIKNPHTRKKEYQRRKESGRQKDYHLQYFYNSSLEEYQEKFEEQGGVCAICGRPEQKIGFMLSLDHNHENGQIRGLLCSKCNYALGHFREDVSILASAINYLNKWEIDDET